MSNGHQFPADGIQRVDGSRWCTIVSFGCGVLPRAVEHQLSPLLPVGHEPINEINFDFDATTFADVRFVNMASVVDMKAMKARRRVVVLQAFTVVHPGVTLPNRAAKPQPAPSPAPEPTIADALLVVKIRTGAHLYGLDGPESDTDFKAVFVPSLEDLLLGRAQHSVFHSTGEPRIVSYLSGRHGTLWFGETIKDAAHQPAASGHPSQMESKNVV